MLSLPETYFEALHLIDICHVLDRHSTRTLEQMFHEGNSFTSRGKTHNFCPRFILSKQAYVPRNSL